MVLHARQADEYGRQHREYVGLDKRHQKFQQVHEDAEQY